MFEYVEGRDLAGLLRAERPAPARVAGLMARIAEAAHHAHAAGLVHRDLKPSNILVDRQGVPHIADFGLAVREDAQHLLAGEIAGTAAFMAPEQVRGETHRLDGRTDVWALGVILYSALTGRLPFRGRNRRRVFRAILELDPKPPRQLEAAVPRELERICLKCLAKRMTDRYETAAELADDLNSWLASRARRGNPPARRGPAPSGRRRRGGRTRRRRRSYRRGSARSTSRTPTSSPGWSPARATATACPSRSARGDAGSRSRTPRGRSPWG